MMDLTCFDWIKLILKDRSLSFRAKSFAMYLQTFMNTDRDCAWPGYRRICYEMHCSPKTVKKYIQELVDGEYIIVGKKLITGIGGEQEMNNYIINVPTKALSQGKHLIEKVLSDRTKGTSVQAQKVLPQGKHNNNRITKNNKSEKLPFWNDETGWINLGKKYGIEPKRGESLNNFSSRVKQNLDHV